MYMTDFEILKDYKEAKKKNDMIQILADRNLISKQEMIRWLQEHGVNVDKRLLSKKNSGETKAEPKETAAVPTPEPAAELKPETQPAAEPEFEDTDDDLVFLDIRPEEDKDGYPVRTMCVYISGPIGYRSKFSRVEEWLKGYGFYVVNPARNSSDTYKDYIDQGLGQLSDCDMICMLPGWSDYAGALLEKRYAETVGLPELKIPKKVMNELELIAGGIK